MVPQDQVPPHLARFTVEGYRAFGAPATVELGRLTLVIGRNNSGKTALCAAPIYFTQALESGAEAPFPTSREGIDFGPLPSVSFRRQITGLKGTLEFAGSADVTHLTLGATLIPEQGHALVVTGLDIAWADGRKDSVKNVPWPEARVLLARSSSLPTVAAGVQALWAGRPSPKRFHPYRGHDPESVGPFGESAPAILANASKAELQSVDDWFASMHVRLRIEPRRDAFEILAIGSSGEPVSLVDSGAGVAHVLPLVVAVRLARARPSLLCLEQPELHLHPRAHVAVAELLLESLERRPETRLLVETHSDTLVLRIRREIAARRLAPEDVRLYFVDEESTGGSRVKEIQFDDRGTPDWWPKDVFAEPQKEYYAIRRELARREAPA